MFDKPRLALNSTPSTVDGSYHYGEIYNILFVLLRTAERTAFVFLNFYARRVSFFFELNKEGQFGVKINGGLQLTATILSVLWTGPSNRFWGPSVAVLSYFSGLQRKHSKGCWRLYQIVSFLFTFGNHCMWGGSARATRILTGINV